LYTIFINIVTLLANKCNGFRIYECKVFILQVQNVGSFFFIIIFVVCSEKRAAPPFKSRRINSKVMPLQARCGPEGGYSYSSTVL